MLGRLITSIVHRTATKGADRMIASLGIGALDMARHAVMAARERDRGGYWSRVLTEVEGRSSYRPY